MKKSLLFMSAVAIFAAASCNKELPAPSTEHAPKTFTATVDDADTKTVLNEGKSYWNGTEAIRVLDGTVSKVFETTVENQLTATFTEKDAAVALSGDDYLAIYPGSHSEHATWSGDVTESAKKLWLKDYQEGIVGSYDPEVHAAIAYTEADSDNLEFKNIVSLVKVTVGNDNVGDIMFYGNNDEQLAGNFNVKYNDGDLVVDFDGVESDNAKSKIYLRGEKEKGSTYYFAVLPQELEGGFTIEFNIETVPYTKSASAPYTIGRNQIIDLGTIEFDVNPITYKTVYMRPGSIWEKTESACYAAWSWVKNGDGGWFKGVDSDNDGIYEFTVPEDNDMIIFAALKTETLAWENNVYYQTADLDVPASENAACIIKNTASEGKQDSEWSTLDEAKGYSEPTVKMYLKPSEGWTVDAVSYGVFAWIEDTEFADWYEMTETEDEGIYEVEVPEYYPEVIFVAQSAEFTADWVNIVAQTEDLLIPTDDHNAYVVSVAGGWMTFEEAENFVEPEPDPEAYRIYVKNDIGWNNVYLHCWEEQGETDTDITSWPGMTLANKSGDYFYYEIPTMYNGIEIGVKFHNNNSIALNELTFTVNNDIYIRLTPLEAKIIDPNDESTFGYNIYVIAEDNLTNIKIFKWGTVSTTGDYPGSTLSYITYNDKRVYYYTIPANDYNSGFNFLLNINGDSFKSGDYSWKKAEGDVYYGCYKNQGGEGWYKAEGVKNLY